MPKHNNFVTRDYFEEKFNAIMEKLDWLIGKYKSHDEEHALITGQLSDHSDRIEVVEDKLGITN